MSLHGRLFGTGIHHHHRPSTRIASFKSVALIAGLWILAGASLSGCKSAADDTVVRANGEIWPKTLHLAYTPSQDDPEGRLKMYGELSQYLKQRLGMEVELVKTSSYAPVIEAMRANKVDAVGGSPFPYMIAHQKAGAEALITRGKPDGSQGTYSSIIVTSPKTGIRSMDDLRARAKKSTFAFVDAASTSGHLIPRGYLESIGLEPEKSFREVVFTQSHLNSVMTAVAAKTDAAAISRSTYDTFIKKGRIKATDLIVLWQSEPVPSSIWYMRGELPAGLKQAFSTAFIEMDERAPLLIEAFRVTARDPQMVFVPIQDAQFDDLREIAHNIDGMTLLE